MKIEKVVINGKEVECYVVEYRGIKEYYDKSGKLIKIERVEG